MKKNKALYTQDEDTRSWLIRRLRPLWRRRPTAPSMPYLVERLHALDPSVFQHVHRSLLSTITVYVSHSPIAVYRAKIDAAHQALLTNRLNIRLIPSNAWVDIPIATFFLTPDGCYGNEVHELTAFIDSADVFIRAYLAACDHTNTGCDANGVVQTLNTTFQNITHVIDVLTKAQLLLE